MVNLDHGLLQKDITSIHNLYLSGKLQDYEFVGAYIIVFSYHKSSRWCMGITSPALYVKEKPGYALKDLPGIPMSSYLEEHASSLTIVQFFSKFIIKDVKRFVNESLVHWANGDRPFVLCFHIPPVDEVLQMQSNSKRVITAFVSDLSTIINDDYPPFKERDCLEFLIHDLQHMERFLDSDIHEEQVGFFKSFSNLLRYPLRYDRLQYFKGYDDLFYKDLDHLLSDMNACVIHLFKFFKAKWIGAETRRLYGCLLTSGSRLNSSQLSEFHINRFTPFAEDIGMDASQIQASLKFCVDELEDDRKILRQFFKSSLQ